MYYDDFFGRGLQMKSKYLTTFYWSGIIVSVLIGYWLQDRENKKLEKELKGLEDST